MEERKGIFTPEQEQLLDELIVLKKGGESIDGLAIRLLDNYGIETLKSKLLEKSPETLPILYEIVDALMNALGELLDKE